MRFAFDATDACFIPGDPFASHVMNVLHMLLPAGERWLCRVYRQAEPLIEDAQLADDVRGFILQEAAHANAHAGVLAYYAERGVELEPFNGEVQWLFTRLLGDAPFGSARLHRAALKRPWLQFRLGLIAAIEQFTCVLGHWILDNHALEAAGADPAMLALLRWHGAEEVEHRHVAFELHQHLSAGRGARLVPMLLVAGTLSWLWLRGTRQLLRQTPGMESEAALSSMDLLRRFRQRASESDHLPHPRLFRQAIARFLRHDYHPSQEGSLEPALAYLASVSEGLAASGDAAR
jgi:predicted metal-dependent hydrolase